MTRNTAIETNTTAQTQIVFHIAIPFAQSAKGLLCGAVLSILVQNRILTVELKIPGKLCNRSSGFDFKKIYSRNFQFHRRDPSYEKDMTHFV